MLSSEPRHSGMRVCGLWRISRTTASGGQAGAVAVLFDRTVAASIGGSDIMRYGRNPPGTRPIEEQTAQQDTEPEERDGDRRGDDPLGGHFR